MSDAEKNFEVPAYDAEEIETRWQAAWDAEELYKTEESPEKPKKYVLEMFPYPSGDLHMGHARNYTIGDAMARQARMRGFDVLHPMGFDAFGLPAENAAIKHNTQASRVDATQNIATSDHATMRRMGFSYDYDRLFNTCDPEYYKLGPVDLPQDVGEGPRLPQDRLAGELVPRAARPCSPTSRSTDGQVLALRLRAREARRSSQWYFKITDYAQELLDDLDKLEGKWPERVSADAGQLDRPLRGRRGRLHAVRTSAA